MGSIYISKEILNKNVVAFVFFILFVSAYLTEVIGIKALFGGFMAGVIMPSNHSFKKIMSEKIEDFSLVILIPLFFAFTGLRTHIGLINEGDLWSVCGMIILVAIVGKFGSSLLAAKITGQSWKNAFMIGTLMNTRGLMELIVLNIGFDLGILSPQVFTMMVIMTLVTTFMTGPVLSLIEWLNKKRTSALIELSERGMNVLISFGIPQTGGTLLRILNYFIGDNTEEKNVSALHLTPFTDISRSDTLKYEKRSFTKIRSVANELSYKLNPIYKTTNDVTKEILRTIKSENSNLLLMGAAKSIFVKNVLGGKVRNIMDQATCNVGVFIDNEFRNADNILLFIDSRNFKNMLDLGLLLLYHSSSKLTFVDEEQIQISHPDSFDKFLLSANDVTRVDIIKNVSIDNQFLEKYGLMIMDVNHCEQTILKQPTILESNPSILIFEFKHAFLSKL